MRLGEVESLRVCDLKLGDDGARAIVQDSKTDAGVRPVFIPPGLPPQSWLTSKRAENLESTSSSIFPGALSRANTNGPVS